MFWKICLFLVVIFVVHRRWKNRKYQKIYNKCPTRLRRVSVFEHGVNLMGTAEDRMKTYKKLGEEAIYDYNGMVSVWLAHKFVVMCGDALDAEMIMKTCLEKDKIVTVVHKLLGNGSISAPVPVWRPRRKLLAPIFGQKTLNSFVTIFNKQSAILVDQLQLAVGNGNIPLFEKVTKYSMDSVCETALGVQIISQTTGKHPVIQAFYQFSDLVSERMAKPWLLSEAVYRWHKTYPTFESSVDIMKKYVGQIVKEKRQEVNDRQQNNKFKDEDNDLPQSFLEKLMLAGGPTGVTDLELQEETLVMLLAGTDTSSVAMSFTALLLAKHQDIQEKVYQEIKTEIGDTKASIEPNDLQKLKYLEAVLKESMRLYPPVTIVNRLVDNDVTLPSGMTLVSGLRVMVNIWAIHRNPKYWGNDAKQFKPDRFLSPLKYPNAFMPFSSGPRSCLGYQYAIMSMKTAMATILRSYKILPDTGSTINDFTDDDLPLQHTMMIKHTGNFEIQLELR